MPFNFGTFKESKVFETGVYFRPGNYLLEVQKLICEQKRTGDTFIAEFKVLESSPTGELDREGKPYQPNPAGSTVSYVVKLSNPMPEMRAMAAGNVIAFLMALTGESKEACEENVEAVCAKDQPLKYALIRDVAFNKPQKQNPSKDFTYHKWQHVPLTDAQIAEIGKRRQAEAA